MSNYQQKIDQAFAKFKSNIDELQRILPQVLANEAVDDVLNNFDTESFNGMKWQETKSKDGRKILVRRGFLKRSVQVYGTSNNGFKLGSDLPYAAVHNNGLTIKRARRSETFQRNRVKKGNLKKGIKKGQFAKGTSNGQGFSFKAYSFKMPMRKFIGETVALRVKLYRTAKQEYLRIFNKS